MQNGMGPRRAARLRREASPRDGTPNGVRQSLQTIYTRPFRVAVRPQYLVFEYVERNLLEVLEEHPGGLEAEQVRWPLRPSRARKSGTTQRMHVAGLYVLHVRTGPS